MQSNENRNFNINFPSKSSTDRGKESSGDKGTFDAKTSHAQLKKEVDGQGKKLASHENLLKAILLALVFTALTTTIAVMQFGYELFFAAESTSKVDGLIINNYLAVPTATSSTTTYELPN